MPNEKLNERYILYQILVQNLEALKQQIGLVEQQMFELSSTVLSIDDLKKMNENNEIFLPLGSGCYGSGKIMDNKRILVNAGAGIFINDEIGAAKVFIEERAKELERAGKEIEMQMERLVKQINQTAAEIQKIAGAENRKS